MEMPYRGQYRLEHRSFKEQEIDREPTIHIGATANVLERKGIQTERGNINREIVKRNMMLEQAKIRGRKGRLDLPIVSGKHLRKISGRTSVQSADNAERFITTRKIDSFESLANFTADKKQKYGQLETVHLSKL